jgi:hypothetical protein
VFRGRLTNLWSRSLLNLSSVANPLLRRRACAQGKHRHGRG